MRTHTLFAVALASFLINFSDATTGTPVDGVLANVVPGGTGNLVGTTAGLVAPVSVPSPGRRKKKRDGLPLAGALPAGITPGVSVAGLGTAIQDGKQSTGGLLSKRGLFDGLLGGGSGKKGKSQAKDASGRQGSKGAALPASAKKDGLLGGGLPVGNILKRDILGGGLPVVGDLLGDGKTSNKNIVKQAAVTNGKGSRARKPRGGRGRGRGRARNQRKAQPAGKKASSGGLLGGGLPVVGGLLS